MRKLFSFKRAERGPANKIELDDVVLPSFPAVTLSVLDAIRDPDASFNAIADLVVTDPGLTARLLTMVNSAAFGLKNRVKSVHHAVCLLGRGQLESVVLSMAVHGALPSQGVRGYEASRFWTTAARRAVTAAALAELIDPSHRSESFTASLLQDMALPILAHQRADSYGPVLEHWHHTDVDLAALEREEFGWDHAGIGAWIGGEWKFPEDLARAIGVHHAVENGGIEEVPLPAAALVAALREVNERPGVERLVAIAKDVYAIPEDQTAARVRESFEQANGLAATFSSRTAR